MRNALILVVLAMLAACAAPATLNTPEFPDRPAGGAANFLLEADPRVLEGRAASDAAIPSGRLDLPQLIDIAQRNNPRTRAAWLRARQAAEAVGLVDTAYLPRVNAQILMGRARTDVSTPDTPAGLLPDGSLSLGGERAIAAVTVNWLLFDFGRREAARGEAQELAFAANVGFTGAHQSLIYEVTQAYHDLYAAQQRQRVHERRLINARALSRSTLARRAQGLSTVTDVAQAKQSVAQARFDLARAQSKTRSAHTRLVALLGLPAGHALKPAFPKQLRLPRAVPRELETHIANALARRPDLQAAFARARASKQHVRAVEAEFRPRIVAAATFGHTLGRADIPGGPGPTPPSASNGRPVASVLVGISIPLWDAGAKERRRAIAQDQYAATLAEAESLRLSAEAEIVGAYELLRSSLEANIAAGELVATSRVSYDAARRYAEEGLATVAEVSLAQQLLFDAEIARIDAQHAALSAAATLAFASGQLG